jgi:ATP-dependent helicase YprA (DUF1998 family)
MTRTTMGTALAGLLSIAIALPAAAQSVGNGRSRPENTHDLVMSAMQRPIDYLVLMLDRVPDEAVPAVQDAIDEMQSTRDDALAELDQPDRAITTVTEGTTRAEDVLGAEMNKQTTEIRAALHKAQIRIQGGRAQALTALRQR